MFSKKDTILRILLFSLFFISLHATTDIWNRLVYFQSRLDTNDYTVSSSEPSKSDINRSPYSLQLYSNHTFKFVFQQGTGSQYNIITGSSILIEEFSIYSNTYQLSNSQLQGTVSHQLNNGLQWHYNLQIKSRGINIKRQQISLQYINWLFIVIFGVAGIILLPLSDSIRNKLLYNIRKRTHPFMCYIILLKLLFLVSQFLNNCYHIIMNIPWYYLLFIYGIYLTMLGPCIIQALYFMAAIQRQIKEYEWFKALSVTIRCLILSFIILSIPVLIIFSVFFSKGIYLFFALSLVTIYQNIYSCQQKRYGFTKILIYDLILNGALIGMSYFLPSLNFTIISLKQVLIFQNFYIGIFIFGIIFSRKVINMEIIQEIQLEQQSGIQKSQTQSQRRQQIPTIQTNQNLGQ